MRRILALLAAAALIPACGGSGAGTPAPYVPPLGVLDTTFGGGLALVTSAAAQAQTAVAAALMPDGRIVIAGDAATASVWDYYMARVSPDGTMDSTLGTGGIATVPHSGYDMVAGMLVQPDAKIVIVGSRPECLGRFNPDGSPDTTFDGDGFVALPNFSPRRSPRCLALQPDGKILIAGSNISSFPDFAVARVNPDGSLDTTFDGDGFVNVAIDQFLDDFALCVLVQPDHKILVGGRVNRSPGGVDLALIRLNPNGSLDTTFDGDGIATLPGGGGYADPYSMALQPDGKILVSGAMTTAASLAAAIWRFNADGSPDTSFDGDGVVINEISGDHDYAYDIAVQPDGKIVVVGTTASPADDPFILRYMPDGSPDASFASGGKRIFHFGSYLGTFRCVLLQPDGKIVAFGTSYGPLLVRMNPDGSLDPTFAPDGLATAPAQGSTANASGAAVQADGGIVVVGSAGSGSTPSVMLSRFSSQGVLDPLFGSKGTVITSLGSGGCSGSAVAVQADGKIVVAGATYTGSNGDFLVLRYNPDGTLDTTFDGDGMVVTPIGTTDERAYAVAILPDGKILAAGSTFNGTGTRFAIVRYLSNGALDTSFDGDGILTTDLGNGWNEVHALAVYPDGRFLAAGTAWNAAHNDSMAVVRYLSNGALDPDFSGGGIRLVPFGTGTSTARAMTLMPDRRIVLAGSRSALSGQDTAVARLLDDGSLDATFDGDGLWSANLQASLETAWAVAVQPDNSVLVAGDLVPALDFALLRLSEAGVPDAAFGSAGVVTTDFRTRDDSARAVIVLPDGRILVAGSTESRSEFGVAVYR